MNNAVILDTTFLISLVDKDRPNHVAAKKYYRFFLEQQVIMMLPTVVAAEFAVKQSVRDLPLHNFRVLPFNLVEAERCGELNAVYFRSLKRAGKRDSVKDDFKIIAQGVEQEARLLITEDEETLARYCDRLRNDGKVKFRTVSLQKGYDETLVNQDGQATLDMEP